MHFSQSGFQHRTGLLCALVTTFCAVITYSSNTMLIKGTRSLTPTFQSCEKTLIEIIAVLEVCLDFTRKTKHMHMHTHACAHTHTHTHHL